MKKIFKRFTPLALIVVFFALAAGLQRSQNLEHEAGKKQQITFSKKTRLSVAVVNEDIPVKKDDRDYQLGASYIKKLEKDDSQDWQVVSRAGGDKGLQEGKYQLLLTIPSDFSSKILDLDQKLASPSLISYKVNGGGQAQLEKEASLLAKEMVADLNQQVIEMYMAAIMSNLYAAQKNVQVVAGVEAANIGTYKTNLYQVAMDQQGNFPSLVNLSTSALAANNGLKDSLTAYNQTYISMQEAQLDYQTNLQGLMKQRADEKMSQAAFAEKLLSMDQAMLSEDNQAILADMETAQKELEKALASNQEEGQGESYESLTKDYQQSLAKLEAALGEEEQARQEQNEGLTQFVGQKLRDYYGLEEGASLSLAILTKKDPKLEAQLTSAFTQGQNHLEQLVKRLPTSDPASLGNEFVDLSLDASAIENLLGYSLIYDATSQSELANLRTEKEAAAAQLDAARKSSDVELDIEIKNLPATASIQSLTYTNAKGETTNLEANRSSHVTLSGSGGSLHINYSLPNQGSQTSMVTIKEDGTTKEAPQATGYADQAANVDVSIQNIHFKDLDENLIEDAENSSEKFSEKVAEIRSAYIGVHVLLDSLYPKDSQGQRQSIQASLLKLDLTQEISQLLIHVLGSKGEKATSQSPPKASLEASLTDFRQLGKKLEENRSSLQSSNRTILSQIALQKEGLLALAEKMKEVTEAGGSLSQIGDRTDGQSDQIGQELSQLMSQTQSSKDASQATLDMVDQTQQSFQVMHTEFERAKSNTEQLKTDAESLMLAFDQELKDSGDFVASFSKVFNQAYENGVPNQTLLTFLTQPVKEEAAAVKANRMSKQPFTWVLLIVMTALFSAYLFATAPIIQPFMDRFQDKGGSRDRLLHFFLLTGVALLLGLVEGGLVLRSLQLETNSQVYLFVFIVAVNMILSQLLYLLLRIFPGLTMAMSFLLILSYIYLGQDLGAGLPMKGLPFLLSSLHPLLWVERQISGLLGGQQPIWFINLFLLFLVIVLTAGPIFLQGDKRLKSVK